MKKILYPFVFVIIALWILPGSAPAQIVKPDTLSHWKKKLVFNLNINQAAFSSNWKSGGVNSIGLNSVFNYQANYSKDKNSWDNQIDMLYGFVNNSGQGYRKTLDRIFLDTKYGYKLNDKWGLFTSLNFLSQFAEGHKYEKDANGVEQSILISDIFAPAFITSSWGIEYHPVDYFSVRISPFSPRVTIAEHFWVTIAGTNGDLTLKVMDTNVLLQAGHIRMIHRKCYATGIRIWPLHPPGCRC